MRPVRTAAPDPEPLTFRRLHAARSLGISPAELRKWELEGFGPSFIRRGRVVLYPADSLRAWVERNAVDPADGAA